MMVDVVRAAAGWWSDTARKRMQCAGSITCKPGRWCPIQCALSYRCVCGAAVAVQAELIFLYIAAPAAAAGVLLLQFISERWGSTAELTKTLTSGGSAAHGEWPGKRSSCTPHTGLAFLLAPLAAVVNDTPHPRPLL
jgi:hypothetical protein